MIETLIKNWDEPELLGLFAGNLGKTSALLGYTSTTEYIDPVEIFIEKEPDLASKLIIYWVNKPNGLKTVFEGMYKIIDGYAHSHTNKSKPVKIEKDYKEEMFKSLKSKKLTPSAVSAIAEHFNKKKPVRRPRSTSLPDTVPMIKSLISPAERKAIDMSQEKIMAETQVSSASKNNRAIKSKIARNTVAKMKADADKIEVPIPKPKKERKARTPRTPKPPKPTYKISYSTALKMWNMNHNTGMYCSPKKNTDEYKAVQQLRL
jgi:hypothetical protein